MQLPWSYHGAEDAAKPEVADLHVAVLVQEDVLWLQVAMQDAATVDVVQALCQLDEVRPNLPLGQSSARRAQRAGTLNDRLRVVPVGGRQAWQADTHLRFVAAVLMTAAMSPPRAYSIRMLS